jgi:2-methylisocitrate lyase-like PEP mutase family enzyme
MEEEACRRIPAPVLPAYLGAGPEPTVEQLNGMGAAMVLYPGMTTGVALQATWELLNDFKQRGTADAARKARASRWGAVNRDPLLQNQKVRDLERDFLPGTLQRDYEHTFGWGRPRPD